MKKILVLKTSTNGPNSQSTILADAIVSGIQQAYPGSQVKEVDLSTSIIPHIEGITIGAFYTPPELRNKAAINSLAQSDSAIADLMDADITVIGIPMYNFGIPSVLKAWVDQIARVGVTFAFDETGVPKGKIHGKKVYLSIASGGIYSEGPMKQYDFTEPYMRSILGYLGIYDITVVRSEGSAMPGMKEKSIAKGLEAVAALSY